MPSVITPPVWMLTYALDDRTGTPAAGDSFIPTLTKLGQASNSISKTAVASVNAAGAVYDPAGGVVCTPGSAYYLDVVPTGAELTTLQQKLETSAMVEGETLLVWATFTTPAGWAAAHSSSNTLLSFGSLVSGSASGGLDFSIGSTERPQVLVWAKGATAQMTAIAPDAGFCIDSALHAVVYEVVCTGANTFKVRVHLCAGSGIVTTSAYSADTSFSDTANGGTAAPGCGASGMRLLRRNGTSTNQSLRGETVRQLGLARLPGEYAGVGPRACIELFRRPSDVPTVLRLFSGDVPVSSGQDGKADRAFGAIALSDMFSFVDGGTPLAEQPIFTIETEGGPHKNTGSSSPLTQNANYVSTADFEGTYRASNPAERKFGRIKTGPMAGWLILSGNRLDGGNRGRAEVKWAGSAVEILPGVEHWMAGRYHFDFMTDPDQAGQLVIMQMFPGPVPKDPAMGLYPPFSVTLDTTNERLAVQFLTAATSPTLVTDRVETELHPAPFNTPANFRTLLQRTVDIVVLHKWHWDATQGPRCRVWIDGALIVDYQAPYGYRGPKGGADAKPVNGYMQCGCYPPSPYLTPNTKRDVYIKRALSVANGGNYTEAQIRAALST